MYVSRIVFKIKADDQTLFKSVAEEAAQAALKMSGCQNFMLLSKHDHKGEYVLYEEWDTAEHADAFKRSKIRLDLVAKAASMMAAPPDAAEFEAILKD